MKIKGLIDEDMVNYKKCSMYIIFPYCSFKCDKENGSPVCQNSQLATAPEIDIDVDEVCQRYIYNPLTEAIVIAGLEPFDSPFDLITFIDHLRNSYSCQDDIVIYTGYTEEELTAQSKLGALYQNLQHYPNIVIKFGRFIPNQVAHFDEVLGVNLASDNQYGKRIS